MRDKKKVTVGLIGNYGWDNLGDELLLSVFYKYLQSENFNIIIYSQNPSSTSYKYPNTNIYNCSGIKNLFSFKNLVSFIKLRYLIFGGGGILNDYYIQTPRWVNYWQKVARIFGVKTLLVSVGLTPFFRISSMRLYSRIISRSEYVSVRDIDSFKFINEKMNYQPNLSRDAVFLLPVDYKNNLKKMAILISLRQWNFDDSVSDFFINFADLINSLSELETIKEFKCVFLAFEDKDEIVIEKILEKINSDVMTQIVSLKCENDIGPIFNEAIITIGMRFHSLVLSSLYRVPFIGLNYDSKVETITREMMGEEFIVNFKDDKEKILRAIKDIFMNNSQLSENLEEEVKKNKAIVHKDFEKVLSIIKE